MLFGLFRYIDTGFVRTLKLRDKTLGRTCCGKHGSLIGLRHVTGPLWFFRSLDAKLSATDRVKINDHSSVKNRCSRFMEQRELERNHNNELNSFDADWSKLTSRGFS